MSRKSEMRASGLVLLLILALVWGVNWSVMKRGLFEIPPWTFRAYSALGGGLLLLAVTGANRRRIRPNGSEWGRVSLVGLFNVTGFQMLMTFGLMRTSSGASALIAYTMPLWVAVVGTLLGDRPNARLVAALAAGMAGVALLLSRTGLQAAGASPLGAAFLLGCAISWAIGTQLQMRMRWTLNAMALAGWQLVLGSLPMLVVMVLLEGGGPPSVSPAAWICWGYLMVCAMAGGYALWFRLIELTSAQVAAIASLLAPAVAVIAGAVILGEPLGWRELVATLSIISGIALVRRPRADTARPPSRSADP
jgi:drug/metabolite transporter (DMT)-like permease